MAHWSSSTLRLVRRLGAHIAFVGSSCGLSNFISFFLFFQEFLEKFGYKEIDNILLKSINT